MREEKNYSREERWRPNIKRSVHWRHKRNCTAARVTHGPVTLQSLQDRYAQTLGKGRPLQHTQDQDEADFVRPIWESRLGCAEHEASVSMLKNRAFAHKFHNDANECLVVSELSMSPEGYGYIVPSAISLPIATLQMQTFGACSQPGSECGTYVLSVCTGSQKL